MVDRIERNKDLIQEVVESTAIHVGQIATIITTAVADIAREIGEIISDGFEMREATHRAKVDEDRQITDAVADERGVIDAETLDPADLDPAEPQPARPAAVTAVPEEVSAIPPALVETVVPEAAAD
ncbi:MAG: hypothetical protein QM662_06730 [Gordonia sp. (in: high G+C Gram-positive bacteria)]